MSNSATDLAKALAALPSEAQAAALRQFELMKANIEEEDAGPLSVALGAYRSASIPIPPILVEPGLVVRGGITATIGRAGKGKTMFNLNRMMRWAAGLPLFDGLETMEPTHPMRILVVENEGAASLFHERVNTMVNGGLFTTHQKEMVDQNLFVWGDGGYSGLKLDKGEGFLKLKMEIDRVKPDILFIEPLRKLWTGEENSATEMEAVLDKLTAIAAEFQIGVVFSHHEKKGSDTDEYMDLARGSTALEGAVDVMENFRAVKSGEYREVSWSKARYRGEPAPVRMSWSQEAHWYSLVPVTDTANEIIRLVGEGTGATVKDIATELSESESKIRRELNKLLAEQPPRIKRFSVPGAGYMYRVFSGDDEGLGY